MAIAPPHSQMFKRYTLFTGLGLLIVAAVLVLWYMVLTPMFRALDGTDTPSDEDTTSEPAARSAPSVPALAVSATPSDAGQSEGTAQAFKASASPSVAITIGQSSERDEDRMLANLVRFIPNKRAWVFRAQWFAESRFSANTGGTPLRSCWLNTKRGTDDFRRQNLELHDKIVAANAARLRQLGVLNPPGPDDYLGSTACAGGPMQMIPSTAQAISGADRNGDGVVNIFDPDEIVPAWIGIVTESERRHTEATCVRLHPASQKKVTECMTSPAAFPSKYLRALLREILYDYVAGANHGNPNEEMKQYVKAVMEVLEPPRKPDAADEEPASEDDTSVQVEENQPPVEEAPPAAAEEAPSPAE